MATLTTDDRNNLNDSDFAAPGQKLPIQDKAHVQAAMSRFGQTKFDNPADKSAAAKKIIAAAKKFGIVVGDDNPLLNMAEALLAAENDDDNDGDCDTCDGTGKILNGNRTCPDCGGSGDAPVNASEHPHLSKNGGALIRLRFDKASKIEAGEHHLPYLTTGSWMFPDDYGLFEVDKSDLKQVKANFDEMARRQDIPILADGSGGGKLNEDHFPSRAVGWMKGLEFNGDNRLDAIVDFNAVGDQVVENDQYRYVSPEILRNYKDAETGKQYGMTAIGLALTNKPRLKSLGKIAASEGVDAALIACSEKAASGQSAIEAAKTLLNAAQPWATSVLVNDSTSGSHAAFAEGGTMPEPETPPVETPPVETPPAAPPEPAPETPAETPPAEGEQANANLSENNAILAAERARIKTLEGTVTQLSEKVTAQESALKLAETSSKLEGLAAQGKVTPAEVTIFSEKIAELSGPSAWVLEMLDKREPVISFREHGSSKDVPAGMDDGTRMDNAAKALMSERQQKPSDYKAYRAALLEVSGAGYKG